MAATCLQPGKAMFRTPTIKLVKKQQPDDENAVMTTQQGIPAGNHLIHPAKPEPDSGFPQAQTAYDSFWDLISLTPESMHMVMWIMSDRTIPRSLRFMEGFGIHAFRLVNTDGVDVQKLNLMVHAVKEGSATVKLIAPQVGGVKGNEDKLIAAEEKMGGGPSVLYDAVALLPSKDGSVLLAVEPAFRDFVSDALVRRKLIAYGEFAKELLEKANANSTNRSQLIFLDQPNSSQTFITKCRTLRSWPDCFSTHEKKTVSDDALHGCAGQTFPVLIVHSNFSKVVPDADAYR